MPFRMEMMIPCFYYDFDTLPPQPVYLRAPVASVEDVVAWSVSENLAYLGHDGDSTFSAFPDLPTSTSVSLYRDNLVPYGETPAPFETLLPAGSGLGNIALTLPLGEDDMLVMGTAGVGRITGGALAWIVTQTTFANFCPVAIALRGSDALFVYRVGSVASTSSHLRYFTTPTSRSSGTTVPTSWAAYSYTIGGSVQPYNVDQPAMIGIEAVVQVWSDFERAVALYADLTGDGFQPFWVMAFDGPAVDAGSGRLACSGAGCVLDSDFEYTIGQINVEVGAAGSTINYLQFTYTPLINWYAMQALAPLPPGYDSYNRQSTNAGWYFYSEAPSEPTEFWSDLVRAVEVI